MDVKHVLCPVDLTERSLWPLEYAAAAARWYGADLTVLHVVPTFDAVEVQSGRLFDPVHVEFPIRRDDIVEQLRRMLIAAHVAPEAVTLAAEEGEVVDIIVDQALARTCDLVVMGRHERGGVERWLPGSVTDTVLRTAPCPVLTIPPRAAGTTVPANVHSILCPVDFSAASLQALGLALDVARRARARVTLLHAIEWLAEEVPSDDIGRDVGALRAALTSRADERLHDLLSRESPTPCGVTSRVVLGRAHRQVLEAARVEKADLIVMGAQGRGGFALAVLGATTEQVLRHAACPLLTVRAPIQ